MNSDLVKANNNDDTTVIAFVKSNYCDKAGIAVLWHIYWIVITKSKGI